MTTITLAEASHCPRCNQRGETEQVRDLPNRDKMHVLICKNEGCEWYNTGWVVQVAPDGSVFQREQGERGQDKTFPKLTEDQLAYGRRTMEDIEGRDLR